MNVKSLEGNQASITAIANDISLEKHFNWDAKAKSGSWEPPPAEFTSAEAQSLSVDLLFDTFESREDVSTKVQRRS